MKLLSVRLSLGLATILSVSGLVYLGAAQGHTEVPVTRLFTGPDGQTHAEETNLKFVPRPGGDKYEQGETIRAASAQVVRAAPGYVQQWHTAPRRQYLITLSGRGEIEIAGGKKIAMTPGGVLLVEDLTGKGHLTRTIGNQDRVSMIVPLE